MARNDWLVERSRELASVRGRTVESWSGVEMALREVTVDGSPQFHDSQVPFLQLFGLQASLGDGDAVSIGTYQDDDVFGLRAYWEARYENRQWEGIYRWRRLIELPVGEVEHVAVFADEAVLAEVRLRIGGRPLVLVAGEVEETRADGLLFHCLDESVLAFTDPTAIEQVPWIPPRRGPARIHR